MEKFRLRKKILLLVLIIVGLVSILPTKNIIFYPDKINVIKGENKSLNILFPFSLASIQEKEDVVKTTYNQVENQTLKKSYKLNGIDEGETNFQLKLLGFIPVKDFKVNVINRPKLIPGGNAIGVKLNTKGVLVVAVTDVIGIDGKRSNPAKEAGLKVGDSIVKINEIKVKDAEHVVELLNSTDGKKIKIIVERNKVEFETEVSPVQSIQDNCYRLGIWVRDKTAGIGTLTFIDQETKKFGALGHGIADVDTGNLLNVEKGKILNAKISNIQQGKRGDPGEIRGVFYETENALGDINKNSIFGIYGNISENFLNNNKIKPMEIGFKEEVKEGKAHILTTIENNKIEKFDVEILKIQPQQNPDPKSMVVKIVDKKLLEKTGGIVQGMSGCPIIQDGRIIGAITHVFVNDPTKGYGLYIEWMLKQTDKP